MPASEAQVANSHIQFPLCNRCSQQTPAETRSCHTWRQSRPWSGGWRHASGHPVSRQDVFDAACNQTLALAWRSCMHTPSLRHGCSACSRCVCRRRPFLIRALENTLVKLILSLEFYDAAGRQKIAIGVAQSPARCSSARRILWLVSLILGFPPIGAGTHLMHCC